MRCYFVEDSEMTTNIRENLLFMGRVSESKNRISADNIIIGVLNPQILKICLKSATLFELSSTEHRPKARFIKKDLD